MVSILGLIVAVCLEQDTRIKEENNTNNNDFTEQIYQKFQMIDAAIEIKNKGII